MNTAMTVEKDIKMQYKSAWKQEFLFKHDKKWQNIGIIVNVDNDIFHVLIEKSHQMNIKNDWKYIQQKHTHFAIFFYFSKLQNVTKMKINL
jgi:hypothetical protein